MVETDEADRDSAETLVEEETAPVASFEETEAGGESVSEAAQMRAGSAAEAEWGRCGPLNAGCAVGGCERNGSTRGTPPSSSAGKKRAQVRPTRGR